MSLTAQPMAVSSARMAQRLMTADNILILCHKNPDGDTIGCGSALLLSVAGITGSVLLARVVYLLFFKEGGEK